MQVLQSAGCHRTLSQNLCVILSPGGTLNSHQPTLTCCAACDDGTAAAPEKGPTVRAIRSSPGEGRPLAKFSRLLSVQANSLTGSKPVTDRAEGMCGDAREACGAGGCRARVGCDFCRATEAVSHADVKSWIFSKHDLCWSCSR